MLGMLRPSVTWAICPEPYDYDEKEEPIDCTAITYAVCSYDVPGTTIICDLEREGGGTGAYAWAVLNEGDAVCDDEAEYCIFGTESTGTPFCCEMEAEDVEVLQLLGTTQRADHLYFHYDDENVDVDLDNWNTSVIDVFEGEAYGRGGGDYIEGSRVASLDYHDQLFGDDGADHIFGLDGSDEIFGGGGSDPELYGGDGNDTIYGDAGDDYLYGEAHNDTLWGGAGEDKLIGGSGNDTLNGDGDDDELSGGDGTDILSGGDGADKLCGDGDNNDALAGGAGNDSLAGGAGTGDSGDGNGHSGAPGDTCDSGTTESLSNCEAILSFSRPCTVGP